MIRFQARWWVAAAFLLVLAGCQSPTSSSGGTTSSSDSGSFVLNGDFSSGTTHWAMNLSKNWGTAAGDTGDGTITVESGALHIDTTVLGGAYSDVQVAQTDPGFALADGKSYRIKFTAWSNTSNKLDFSVWENGTDTNVDGFDWSTYGYMSQVLTSTPTVYTKDFTMVGDNSKAGVCFFCGYALGEICVDDVSVTPL